MTITEAVAEVYLHATGKTTTLTSGSKYDRIIALLNFYQARWGRQMGVDWNSLYNPAYSIGTVTATDSFDLDVSTVRKLSDREGDHVRIMWTDGTGYTDYDIVPHDKLKDYFWGQDKESPNGFYCARMGGQLVFNHEFVSTDSQFGGDIQIPCYVFPDAITSSNPSTNEVQVDDPSWLTLRSAAAYVRNDITLRQRYPELLDESDEVMERMRDDNDAQIDNVDKPWTPFSGIGNDSAWS
jgi:hypothetical protein